MTEEEMRRASDKRHKIRVQASDYSYVGKVVTVFQKESGAWRCVVEDEQGRLFIHNAGQLR